MASTKTNSGREGSGSGREVEINRADLRSGNFERQILTVAGREVLQDGFGNSPGAQKLWCARLRPNPHRRKLQNSSTSQTEVSQRLWQVTELDFLSERKYDAGRSVESEKTST